MFSLIDPGEELQFLNSANEECIKKGWEPLAQLNCFKIQKRFIGAYLPNIKNRSVLLNTFILGTVENISKEYIKKAWFYLFIFYNLFNVLFYIYSQISLLFRYLQLLFIAPVNINN